VAVVAAQIMAAVAVLVGSLIQRRLQARQLFQ
jgi:hypothetical protein